MRPSGRLRRLLLLAAAGSLAVAIPAVAAAPAHADAPTPSSPAAYWEELPGGSWTLDPNSFQQFSLIGTISPTGLSHNDAGSALHAFNVNNGHLQDAFSPNPFGSPASWTTTDLTRLTGATVSNSVSVGALYLGGSNPSTQVFALGPTGHLLSFTTGGDGGNWQVFDLNSAAGSGTVLTTAPHPIQFGSTVHVYATDNRKHLHDFYKPTTANWTDIDLTNTTPGQPHAIFGVPYAYGGNSIQTVSTTAGGDLETFVQGVLPNGVINPNSRPAAFDITALSGGTELPLGTSSPVVAGSTVNIFVDDTNGNLVDFSKTPTTQWTTSVVAGLGQTNLTPSAYFDASLNTLHVVTDNSSGQLTDYFVNDTGPSSGFQPSVLPSAGATAFGDPSLVPTAFGPSGPTLVTFSNF